MHAAGGWTGRGRLVGVAVLVVAAAVLLRASFLGLQKIDEFHDPAYRAGSSGHVAYLECIEDDLERKVPRGTRLFVDKTEDAEMQQRLAELATPSAVLVDAPAAAQFVVSFDPAPGGAGCGGQEVVLTAPALSP